MSCRLWGFKAKLCSEEEQEQITELPNVLCHEAERPLESRSMAFQSLPPSLLRSSLPFPSLPPKDVERESVDRTRYSLDPKFMETTRHRAKEGSRDECRVHINYSERAAVSPVAGSRMAGRGGSWVIVADLLKNSFFTALQG